METQQYLDLPEIEVSPEQLVTLPIIRASDYRLHDRILLTPTLTPLVVFECKHGKWILKSDIPNCDELRRQVIKFPPGHEQCFHKLFRVKIKDQDPLRHFSEHTELELLKQRSVGMFLIAKFSGYSAILYIPNINPPPSKTVVVYEFDRLSVCRRLFVSYQRAVEVLESLRKTGLTEKKAYFIPTDVKLLKLPEDDL